MNDKINLNIKKLIVKYNNKVVGYLKQLDDNKIAFQYDRDWIKAGFSISPFSLPLSDKIFINKNNDFQGLYGVFNDSLPDGWGRLLLIRMLAKKNINAQNLSPLTKLSLLSDNGLGGLTYYPMQNNNEAFKINLDEIALEAKRVLNDVKGKVDLDMLFALGGSSGGARPKAHIKINNESWIIKFPSSLDPIDIGLREYKANQLAQKCGINVPIFKLFKSNKCTGYFGCKRFDIDHVKKIHAISLSGILETSHRLFNLDYVHLFQVIEKISIKRVEDMYEAYRRMCFNVFFNNKDDHGKNWLFLFDEKLGGYVLSPFYDITSTPNLAGHALSVLNNDNPNEQDLLSIAKQFKLDSKKCQDIINKIKKIFFKD